VQSAHGSIGSGKDENPQPRYRAAAPANTTSFTAANAEDAEAAPRSVAAHPGSGLM
jgi:hypothetical protein